jgi:mitochondrial import receptor subunit TOM22
MVLVAGAYSVLRAASWLLFSSSVILFAPVIFESERVQVEEMQKQQNRQVCDPLLNVFLAFY